MFFCNQPCPNKCAFASIMRMWRCFLNVSTKKYLVFLHTLAHFVCDTTNQDCMMSKCDECPAWLEAAKKDAPLDKVVQWQQWKRVSHPVQSTKEGPKPKMVKRMEKVTQEGTAEEALNSLQRKMPTFLEHVFIKRKQASFFEERIATLSANEAVVQVDFAENYTCQHQDEIQSTHWSQEQVTLFTIAIWAKDLANKSTCYSHVIVSDDHSHERKSVAVFMDTVVNTLVRQSFPHVRMLEIFSDGPTSQFKNKYMANFYHTLQRKGLQIKWHFFATSRAKVLPVQLPLLPVTVPGVVDGIGGTVKRVIWSAVATRKVPKVQCAEAFAKTAAQFNTEICQNFKTR